MTLSAFLLSPLLGSTKEDADKVALKYCKMQLTYSGGLPYGYKGDVNERMFLERMIQLKDGKLKAYYAKDVIERNLNMYKKFLKTGIQWKGAKVDKESKERFEKNIIELVKDKKLVEQFYPKDFKVYDRIDEIRFGKSEIRIR